MAEILLSSGLVALVDDADLSLVNAERKWFPLRSRRTTYAQTSGGVRMHRLILGAGPGEFVDHRNSNGLDNRRENLRLATRRQNNSNNQRRADNTSGFKGVTRTPQARFRSDIHAGGRRALLGHYATAEEAAHAYNLVAALAHGEFARLNVVEVDADLDTRVRAVLRERAGQLADVVQDPRIVAELLGGSEQTHLSRKKAS